MAVTPFETILASAPLQPEEIQISGWKPGEEITVLVKKPNFYALLAKNAIPNPLIPAADRLFKGNKKDYTEPTPEFARALEFIAKECLAEPSYEQLTEAGVVLTDDQLAELCMYATDGAERLRSFRERVRAAARQYEQSVQDAALRAASNPGSTHGVVPGRSDRARTVAPAQRGQAASAEGDGQPGDPEANGD